MVLFAFIKITSNLVCSQENVYSNRFLRSIIPFFKVLNTKKKEFLNKKKTINT